MRLEQGYRFESLDELDTVITDNSRGTIETMEMDRIQYATYKELVWEWMRELNPIMIFRGHPIVVIKRGEEALSTGSGKLANNVV